MESDAQSTSGTNDVDRELARRAGVKLTTVRHYLREGLVSPRAGPVDGSRPYLDFTESDLRLPSLGSNRSPEVGAHMYRERGLARHHAPDKLPSFGVVCRGSFER